MERSEKIVLKVFGTILVLVLLLGTVAYVLALSAMDGATSPRPTMPRFK
jgi:hypothetical protein